MQNLGFQQSPGEVEDEMSVMSSVLPSLSCRASLHAKAPKEPPWVEAQIKSMNGIAPAFLGPRLSELHIQAVVFRGHDGKELHLDCVERCKMELLTI